MRRLNTMMARSLFFLHLVWVFAFIVYSWGVVSFAAEKVEFSEDELAKESVLPVFDKKVAVKNRNITLGGRFELGANLGLNLVDPFYESLIYGVSGAYHFNETHGFNITGVMTQDTLSSNGKSLKSGETINSPYDVSLAPRPESYWFGNYQVTAYYGKLSLTKQTAMNLSLYGLAGLGMVSFGDSTEPALNLGFGQKLYFNSNFALRFDFNLAIHQGPDPTQPKSGVSMTPGSGSHDSDDFKSTIFYRSFLTAGVVILL